MARNTVRRTAGRTTRVVLGLFPHSPRFAISFAIEVGFTPVHFPVRAHLALGGLLHLSVELVVPE